MSGGLADLYARIPKVEGCRTGCADCCGPVPMIPAEVSAVKAFQRPEPWSRGHSITPTKLCGTCSYSTPSGCSIYETRPFMCRLFGTSVEEPRLKCPHGAKPRKPISADSAARLLAEYAQIERSTRP